MKALAHVTFWAALLGALIPSDAGASWVGRPLREFVTESDDVVIATLQNVRTSIVGGYERSEADLTVERSLCGGRKAGSTLPLRWMTLIDSRSGLKSTNALELQKHDGQPRLWLLTREADGSVRADHPHRVMPVEDAEAVLDTLAAYPYRVIAPDRDAGEPAIVSILFRNATDTDIVIPALRTNGGRLTHGDNFALIVWQSVFGDPASRGKPVRLEFDDSLRHDRTLQADILGPGKSKQVDVSFSDLFEQLPPGAYRFAIVVNGRRTDDHGFIVRTDWGSRYNRVRDTPAELAFFVQTLREHAAESREAISLIRFQHENGVTVAPDLMRMCDSLATDVQSEVISLIARMDLDAETRLEFLLERIDHPEPSVRRAAWSGVVQILGNQSVLYRRDEVVARLMAELEDPNPGVRANAANALASIKAIEAVPELQSLTTSDTDERVRRDAARAVEAIEGGNNCCSCDVPVP